MNPRHDSLFPLPGREYHLSAASIARGRDYAWGALAGGLMGSLSAMFGALFLMCPSSSLQAVFAGAPGTPTAFGWSVFATLGVVGGSLLGAIGAGLAKSLLGGQRMIPVAAAMLAGAIAGPVAVFIGAWLSFAILHGIMN